MQMVFKNSFAKVLFLALLTAALGIGASAQAVADVDAVVQTMIDAKTIPAAGVAVVRDGKVVVARTRDGGQNYEILRNGLPQNHAYDLTYRHGLDIDETGNRLAFGSTTGSLWVTEDQGDSWQCVSEHLPPIYCVRFA